MEEVMVTSEKLTDKPSGLLALLDELEKRGASDAEKTNAMRAYLDAKAREKGIPVRGTFELTPLCNLNCKMCYVHLTEPQMRRMGRGLLSGRQWIAIMEQAVQAGMIDTLLTGGEALSHPDFDEIYLYLHSHGVGIGVNTNGLLVTPERLAFFKKYPPRSIQLTLYGSDDDSYEKVTGHRCFSQVMTAIERIRDAGFYLSVGITPSKYMIDNGEGLLKLIDSLDVEYSINAGLFDPREETERSKIAHDISLDQYIRLYKLQARMHKRELRPLCIEETPCPSKDGQRTIRGLRCAAGRSSFAVTWRGVMQPCLTMQKIQIDLAEDRLNDGWSKIHLATQEYPFPAECVNCAYIGICSICVVQHETGAPIGHANPYFCQRARRMAIEGIVRVPIEQ